jgi:hypothetical protein
VNDEKTATNSSELVAILGDNKYSGGGGDIRWGCETACLSVSDLTLCNECAMS